MWRFGCSPQAGSKCWPLDGDSPFSIIINLTKHILINIIAIKIIKFLIES